MRRGQVKARTEQGKAGRRGAHARGQHRDLVRGQRMGGGRPYDAAANDDDAHGLPPAFAAAYPAAMDPQEIIERLSLSPHPEGGYYRQTWAAPGPDRPLATCIYFLLTEGQRSHWHRVDAEELWLWHAGAPLTLRIAASEAGPAVAHTLCGDLRTGAPQIVVPTDHWQSAQTQGDYTLVSCFVSPGFTFEGFTLAPPGFDIP